ncbi:THO complex subunit 7 [Castilleja foliolosa]|uniref:THO complex subunit 7 n=1 Tax=Castilleja foliolosa TaxID=1961234 RepID=A0ABD3DEM5_9LAMI
MRHPADSTAWKEFDKEYPGFAADPRNVRLALVTDGFNPFGNMSTSYSMWPVILAPLNLPPWDCMKDPFLFLSLLIPGKHSPGKDIDVYMRPLIDELKELFVEGADTFDVSGKNTFRMHTSILWTINDFPAYGDLSGWSTKRYMACPACNKGTYSVKLRNKICYMGHRRSLPKDHPWRKDRKHFNGKREDAEAPISLTGEDVLSQLEKLPTRIPGKHSNKNRKRGEEELNWTKRSILFELPYWSKLKLRNNLDVMHTEKNICESILGTLMNVEGKTKDTVKARIDLEDMKIRKELHLIKKNNDKYAMPAASYVMTKKERFLCGLKQSVRNKARPEGSVAEAYISKECLTFCSMYLKGIETRFKRDDRNNDMEFDDSLSIFAQKCRPVGATTFVNLYAEDFKSITWFVLQNCDEVEPFLKQHKEELVAAGCVNIEKQHKEQFRTWF